MTILRDSARAGEKQTPFRGMHTVVLTRPRYLDLRDPTNVGPDAATRLQDFVSTDDGLDIRDEFVQLGSGVLSNIPMRLAIYEKENLSRFLIAHTKDKAFRFDDPNWTDIGRAAAYTGTDLNPWDSTVVLDDYVATNYIDKIQYWDGVAGTFLDIPAAGAGLSMELTRAKYVVAYAGRLFLLNLKEGGGPTTRALGIRWSKELSYRNDADWTSVGSGTLDLADTPDPITGAAKLGRDLVVYKQRSNGHLIETGDLATPFVFSLKSSAGLDKGVGLVSHWTLAELTNFHIGLFNDNAYIYDGTRFRPIGDAVIKDIVKRAGLRNITRAFCQVDPTRNWYILWIPLTGQTYSELGYIYDYRQDLWVGQIKRKVSAGSAHFRTTDLTWASATMPWSAANFSWDSVVSQVDFPSLILGNPDTKAVEIADAGVAYGGLAIWDTGDYHFGYPDREKTVRRVRLRIDAAGQNGSLGVAVSNDAGASYLSSDQKQFQASTADKDLIFSLNLLGPKHRFRVTSTAKLRIKQFEVGYIVRGLIR